MDQWTTLQSLILAQLVHKYGDDNWNSVSKQLRTHPLTAMDPAHFTPKNCQLHHAQLVSKNPADATLALHQAAQRLYNLRIEELKSEILSSDQQIQRIQDEIEAIRRGDMDSMLDQMDAEDDLHSELDEDAAKIELDADTTIMELDVGSTNIADDSCPNPSEIPALSTVFVHGNSELQSSINDAAARTDLSLQDTQETSVDTSLFYEQGRDDKDAKSWRKLAILIWQDVANHRHGPVFMQPVKEADYENIVYFPSDLNQIRLKIRDHTIRTSAELEREMLLVFHNAMMYNRSGTHMHRFAQEIRQFMLQNVIAFRQTDSIVKRQNGLDSPRRMSLESVD